jgi:protocatechuate 3,4-dioxygenase beta subunit
VGGGGIGGALISVRLGEGKGETVATTYSADDGTYELTVDAGERWIGVFQPDYVPVNASISIGDQPVTRSFVLTPAGSIEGRVVTRAGDPVPNAKVSASGGRATGGMSFGDFGGGGGTDADADGKFVLQRLGSGLIRLSASAPGWTSNEPATVELGVGETVSDVEIVLDRGYSIIGRVVEEGHEDRGIAGVNVMAVTFGGGGMGGMPPSDTSKEGGAFRIDGVRPGTYSMMAMGKGVIPSFMTISANVKDADAKDVIIALSRGVSLSGRVDPPQRARIGLELQGEPDGLGAIKQEMAAGMAHAETGDDGTFKLDGVPPGKFRVVASAKDGSQGKLPVEVGTSPQDNLVVPLSGRATVDGIVVDAKGVPIADVSVRLQAARGSQRRVMIEDFDEGGSSTTRADGTFHLVGVDPGTYGFRVRDERGTLPPVDKDKPAQVVVAGATPVRDVRVEVARPDGVIRGVVKTKDGTPVPDAWVTASTAAGDPRDDMMMERFASSRPTLTDASGRFTFDKLHDGKYDLVAEGVKGAKRGALKGVDVGADVVIEVRALSGLSGVVTLAGAPVTEYDVSIRTSDTSFGWQRAKHVSAADGRYSVDRLEPGDYTVSVRADGGSAHADVKIEAEADATQDLALAQFGSVRGQVVDVRTRAPIAGVAVLAMTEGAEDTTDFAALLNGKGPRTDAQGRFQIDHLSAGEGQVLVMSDDFHPVASRKYALTAGATVDVGVLEGLAPRPKQDKQGTIGASFVDEPWTKRPGAKGGNDPPPAGITAKDDLLWVSEIDPGGPAQTAGLQVGDRVIAADDLDVKRVGGGLVDDELSSVTPGQVVKLTIERGGAQSTISITAAAAP